MVIFSLFIALLLDRALRNRGHWQLKPIAQSWRVLIQRFTAKYDWARHPIIALTSWVLPAILLGLLLWLQGMALLTLIVNIVVLLVVFGSAPKRELIRMYLQKAHSHKTADCTEVQAELNKAHPELMGAGIQAHIVWLNFRYYFAVAVCFIVFGITGALIYGLLRELMLLGGMQKADLTPEFSPLQSETEVDETPLAQTAPVEANLATCVLYWVEWLPVRLAGFTYLLVGHFSRGLSTWLNGLTDKSTPHAVYLNQVANAADDTCFQAQTEELTAAPCAMLTLVKRSMTLLLAATALATLLGWLT